MLEDTLHTIINDFTTAAPAGSTIILAGIAGSRAHGTHRPDSDHDFHGIYLAPLESIIRYTDRAPGTIDGNEPDYSFHEFGKAISLVMKASPNILELLFLPEHTFITPLGVLLRGYRDQFITQQAVKAHLGVSENLYRAAHKNTGPDHTTETRKETKSARHALRFARTAARIATQGTLTVKDPDPDLLFAAETMTASELRSHMEHYEKIAVAHMDRLPEAPDSTLADELLITARLHTPS